MNVDQATGEIGGNVVRSLLKVPLSRSFARLGNRPSFIKIGKYSIPFGKTEIKGMRKGTPFWHWLGKAGIFSSVIRVPVTFPPEKFEGVLLSGMCVPDLKGSQGTFCLCT